MNKLDNLTNEKSTCLSYERFEAIIDERLKISRKLHISNPTTKMYLKLLDRKLNERLEEFKRVGLYETYFRKYSFSCNKIG
ncbi:hypothetical protein HZA97_09650 [Candidatus Woesearchaeota archaeon]|nr:hypothetical protein [Candidatus Woesearchaeota archaeon]